MMNHESENHSDADDAIERALKSLQLAGESADGQSNGQLMYAMGFAAGVADAQRDAASRNSISTASNRLWQFATVAVTVVAAALSFQLFSKAPDSDPVAMNHVEASEDKVEETVAAENVTTVRKTFDSLSKRVRALHADSFVRSFFLRRSEESAFSRRDQILGAAESVNLDEALEQFVSVASQRKPARKRNDVGQQSFSPRSAIEDLLNSDEFLGL